MTRTSNPAPPLILVRSSNLSIVMTSSPAPPSIASRPAPPVKMSLPLEPIKRSSPSPPLRTALRDEVVTDIHRFTNEYPAVRSVATSRWLGYKAQRLRDAGFQHFMLQELTDEQMQEFVVRSQNL